MHTSSRLAAVLFALILPALPLAAQTFAPTPLPGPAPLAPCLSWCDDQGDACGQSCANDGRSCRDACGEDAVCQADCRDDQSDCERDCGSSKASCESSCAHGERSFVCGTGDR